MPPNNAQTLTPEQQLGMAPQVREEKNKGTADYADETADSSAKGEQPKSLREKVIAAKRKMDLKQRVKDKFQEKVMAPAKMGLNNALRSAWYSVIPSFGLSLIYINIHVFLRWTLGEKLFCKLGEEWLPKKVSGMAGDAGKTTAKGIGIVEVMGLGLLNAIAFFIIMAVLAILVWLADNMILKGVIWVLDLIS